jgi:hypothetical protein
VCGHIVIQVLSKILITLTWGFLSLLPLFAFYLYERYFIFIMTLYHIGFVVWKIIAEYYARYYNLDFHLAVLNL